MNCYDLSPFKLILQIELELNGDSADAVTNEQFASMERINSESRSASHFNTENMSFQELLSCLSCSYNKEKIFTLWLDTHREIVESLSPRDLQLLFQVFNSPEAQIDVAKKLKFVLSQITCSHIAEAVVVCTDTCRRIVCEQMCTIHIIDKQNADIVRNTIGPLDFLSLERYFHTTTSSGAS